MKSITEKQLKNAIKWHLTMHICKWSKKVVRKSEKVNKRLWDYVNGNLKLRVKKQFKP